METKHSIDDLRSSIAALELKQKEEELMMKSQFHTAYESVKPINLIKSTFKEVTDSPDIKDNLINATIGITAGYLGKKLFEGVTHTPLRKLLGTVVMFGITNAVAKNPEFVKSAANGVLKLIAEGLHPPKDAK